MTKNRSDYIPQSFGKYKRWVGNTSGPAGIRADYIVEVKKNKSFLIIELVLISFIFLGVVVFANNPQKKEQKSEVVLESIEEIPVEKNQADKIPYSEDILRDFEPAPEGKG